MPMNQGAARVSPQDPGNFRDFTLTMRSLKILEKSCAARAKGHTLQLLPRLFTVESNGRTCSRLDVLTMLLRPLRP
eukprot:7391312-Prymnesium_polylepis.1